jgi:hypothetical protein
MEEEAEASYGGRGEDSMLSPREESSSWDWEGTRLEELLPQALVLSLCVVCVCVCTVERDREQADKAGLPPLQLACSVGLVLYYW